MKQAFSVSTRGAPTVTVQAVNWVCALGEALERLHALDGMDRLACEALPNGSIIARNITSGVGYVVQKGGGTNGESVVEIDMRRAYFDESLASADDRMAVCQSALRLAQETVSCEAGSVLLEDRGYLRFVAVSGPAAAKLVGVRIPSGVGIAGYAMARKKAVLLSDAQRDPRHCHDVDAVTGFETRQMLVVPVVTEEGTVLGALELVNRPAKRDFTTTEGRLLEALGQALAARLQQMQVA